MPAIPLDLIRFDEPDTILICRRCETHLALGRHIIEMADDPHVNISHMVNIFLSDSYRKGNQVKAQVSCRLCRNLLGTRIVYMLVPDGLHVTGQFRVNSMFSILSNGHEEMNPRTRAPIVEEWRYPVIGFNIPMAGNFYECRYCSMHLAQKINERSPESLIFPSQLVYNVHWGEFFLPVDHDRRKAKIYCSVCYRRLGSIRRKSDPGVPGGQNYQTKLDRSAVTFRNVNDLVTEINALSLFL